MTPEQIMAAQDYISLCEKDYFTGSFSENTIRFDLATRPEKKQFYMNDLNEVKDYLELIYNTLKDFNPNYSLLTRCAKCKNQVDKLHAVVLMY